LTAYINSRKTRATEPLSHALRPVFSTREREIGVSANGARGLPTPRSAGWRTRLESLRLDSVGAGMAAQRIAGAQRAVRLLQYFSGCLRIPFRRGASRKYPSPRTRGGGLGWRACSRLVRLLSPPPPSSPVKGGGCPFARGRSNSETPTSLPKRTNGLGAHGVPQFHAILIAQHRPGVACCLPMACPPAMLPVYAVPAVR
jgi:hypothetical protein